jgi:hypothetical protein
MPRIVYMSWPAREISGGIKAAYQHVELLVEGAMEAVIATPDGAAPNWFATKAQTIHSDAIRADDMLVFPENNAQYLAAFAARAQPKVVFCQNAYLAHRGLNGRASYAEFGVTHIMCPSHSVLQFCAHRFPGVKAAYTPYFIDHSRFVFTTQKTLQIAAIPRKRATEYGAIRDLLRAGYPEFDDVAWAVLHGVSEEKVAADMGRSAVFLSLARLEAHSMTALEAMASGCIVAGFRGIYNGNDSATIRNGFWAEEDDVHGCVEQLVRALRLARRGGDAARTMVEEGRLTAGAYSREEAARQLLQFWRKTAAEFGTR